MTFKKGNELWRLANPGRPRAFNEPADMLEAALAYFDWVKENPLQEEKLFHYQGSVTRETVNKMRAMTMDGLILHMGIGLQTWYDYKAKPEFSEVTKFIDSCMREQKFTGAAADLLNPNIIARDLGLKENSEVSGGISINVNGKLGEV